MHVCGFSLMNFTRLLSHSRTHLPSFLHSFGSYRRRSRPWSPRIEWRYKLEVARIFLRLIQDGQVIQLESAMIAFFWPEIQLDPSLLDIVSTARTSSSRRNRIKQLISALLCLQVLSLPSLHAQAKPMVSNRPGPKRMPAFIFYRYLGALPSLECACVGRPQR